MKVLVVVDAQEDFITGSLGSEEAVEVVSRIVKKIKSYKHNDSIIATIDTHGKEYLQTQEGRFLPVKHCIKSDIGWLLNEDIEDAIVEMFAVTVFKSTFGSKDLPFIINSECMGEEIESIELVGYVLDICVISNAILLKAFFPEVPITVDTTCCAATSPEAREAAKTILRSCQIGVIE